VVPLIWPAKNRALNGASLQRIVEIARVEEIVLDGVAGSGEVGVFQSSDRADQCVLNIERQAGGNAVGIDFVGLQAFRFQEDLVGILIGEAVDLVFDRRAVTRPDPFDHAGVHRRAIQAAADDVVGARVGLGDPARDLRRVFVHRAEMGKHRTGLIARLLGQLRKIDASPIQARRGPGLEPTDPQRQFAQPRRQGVGRRIAGTAAFVVGQSDVDAPGQKGAGGQHHRAGGEADAGLRHHAGHPIAFEGQVGGGLLEYVQVRLVFDQGSHRRPI
jgi:hypothetical protein